MNTFLTNKRILFICPMFFDYDKIIVKELNAMGASVDSFSDRPYNFTYIILRNINRSILINYQLRFWKRILEKIRDNEYDYLFVIRGENVPQFLLDHFINKNPNARRIMYQWDSISNNNYLSQVPYFHQVFSFDKGDTNQYKNIKYFPLFFRREYDSLVSETNSMQALFIGTYQTARYQTLKLLQKRFKLLDLRFKIVLFVPWYYYLKLLFRGVLLDLNIISFRTISFEKCIRMYAQSTIIVDIAHEKQSGLTMRTMEALGANKFLWTNNLTIKNEQFYEKGKIQIISEKFDGFSRHTPRKSDFICDYRIDRWLSNLFSRE